MTALVVMSRIILEMKTAEESVAMMVEMLAVPTEAVKRVGYLDQ